MSQASLQRIDASGNVLDVDSTHEDRRRMLREGEAMHREVRTQIGQDYCALIEVMFAEGMFLTQLVDAGEVRSVALWRAYHTTYDGRRFEVDDLVTRASDRSRGYGAVMLREMANKAASLGCQSIVLNSATYRQRAHKFYFREGFSITAFHFTKPVKSANRR
jgi:GNAT superfamily N-acetyltransferase